MTQRTSTPPVDCDSCGAEITAVLDGGNLDCEVVDLHDGGPVADICRPCTGKPLAELIPRIKDRKKGHPMRPGPVVEETEETPAPAPADDGK